MGGAAGKMLPSGGWASSLVLTSSGGVAMGQVGGTGTGSGSPLPHAVRLALQHEMGVDLSVVRVQKGFGQGNAAAAAKAAGRSSYVEGKTIHVGAEAFNSSAHTKEGKELLAHEAWHTVQQGGQPPPPDPDDRTVAYVSGPDSRGRLRSWKQRPGEAPRAGWAYERHS